MSKSHGEAAKMKRGEWRKIRWSRAVGVFALTVLAALTVGYFLPPSHDLLRLSRRLRPALTYPYDWISDHELLGFEAFNHETRTWIISRQDVSTGRRSLLPGLSELFRRKNAYPIETRLSPKGENLAGWDRNEFWSASLNGEVKARWKEAAYRGVIGIDPVWSNDGHTLMYGESGVYDPKLICSVMDVEHHKKKRWSYVLSELSPGYDSPLALLPNGDLFTYSSYCEPGPIRNLTLVTPGREPKKRKFTVHAPPGCEFLSVAAAFTENIAWSPHCDRIAWLCRSHPASPPLPAGLHRILPEAIAHPKSRASIWISRADGSGMRELGGVDELDGFDRRISPIIDLRWLPSGKGLSFVNRGWLYQVAVK